MISRQILMIVSIVILILVTITVVYLSDMENGDRISAQGKLVVLSQSHEPHALSTMSHEEIANEIMNIHYQCDSRNLCTQMNSCEEARYFLANCPNVQMDRDRNGIPCEGTWCKGYTTDGVRMW